VKSSNSYLTKTESINLSNVLDESLNISDFTRRLLMEVIFTPSDEEIERNEIMELGSLFSIPDEVLIEEYDSILQAEQQLPLELDNVERVYC
jgi:hypothetical protein